MTTYIVLLRGINVGGHNRVPMPELRASCEDLGWTGVRSYIHPDCWIVSSARP